MCLLLAVETSCDDTSVAALKNGKILATLTSGQKEHDRFGGIVPEVASRAHQKNLIPLLERLLKETKLNKKSFDAIAFTAGPGLLGSLLTGTVFSKSLAQALEIPLVAVDHLHGHLMSHFIEPPFPAFPYLCLLVSGGHTLIVRVDDPLSYTVMGRTVDDAAGEAFDKGAKIMGLAYPGGPLIDRFAASGNPNRFPFPEPKMQGLNMSFSGLKTSLLYLIRDNLKNDPDFIQNNLNDLCASYQEAINGFLIRKLRRAVRETGIREIGIAGGVAANINLRSKATEMVANEKGNLYIPAFEYCMDNAAMIAVTGWYQFKAGQFADHTVTPYAKSPLKNAPL